MSLDYEAQEATCLCGEITLLGEGQTALHVAAALGHADCLRRLLERKGPLRSKVNVQDGQGESALHEAVNMDSGECVRVLCEVGADLEQLNGQNGVGVTPLFSAVRQAHHDAVSVLLEFGAEVNCSNEYGQTPLHVAASRNDVDLTRELLGNGADLSVQTHNGQTAFELASAFDNHEVMELLQMHADKEMAGVAVRVEGAGRTQFSEGDGGKRPEVAGTDEEGGGEGGDEGSQSGMASLFQGTINRVLSEDDVDEEENGSEATSLETIPSLPSASLTSEPLGDSNSSHSSHGAPVVVSMEDTEKAFARSPPLNEGGLRGASEDEGSTGGKTVVVNSDNTMGNHNHNQRRGAGGKPHQRQGSQRKGRYHSHDSVNDEILGVGSVQGGVRARTQSVSVVRTRQESNGEGDEPEGDRRRGGRTRSESEFTISTLSSRDGQSEGASSSSASTPTVEQEAMPWAFKRVTRRTKSTNDVDVEESRRRRRSYSPPPEPLLQSKWMADEDAPNCCSCNTEFGWIMTRRHHCRFCGKVFCANCSSNWWSHWSNKEQKTDVLRVCSFCAKILVNKGENVDLDVAGYW